MAVSVDAYGRIDISDRHTIFEIGLRRRISIAEAEKLSAIYASAAAVARSMAQATPRKP